MKVHVDRSREIEILIVEDVAEIKPTEHFNLEVSRITSNVSNCFNFYYEQQPDSVNVCLFTSE
jgi:hypothetical protein